MMRADVVVAGKRHCHVEHAGGVVDVVFVGKLLRFKHVDCGACFVGLLGVFDEVGDFFGVAHGVHVVVCAGDVGEHKGVFLVELFSLFEEVFGGFLVAFLEGEFAEAYIVVGVVFGY